MASHLPHRERLLPSKLLQIVVGFFLLGVHSALSVSTLSYVWTAKCSVFRKMDSPKGQKALVQRKPHVEEPGLNSV